ncbi:MAG: peptide deformylase [Gammaproteobacteria bacterium]|nr:peptide deformylase [Gammaproteobacteria bacterium]
MTIKRIITAENPDLRRVAKPVDLDTLATENFRQFAQDMRDSLADSGGIGLVAPQIAEPLRVVLFDVRDTDARIEEDAEPLLDTLCINPEVSVFDATTQGHWEGCLSVPGFVGYVERPQGLLLSYFDEDGQPQQRKLSGFLATVGQHELDHLDGILYIDRIFDRNLLISQEQLEADTESVT